MQEIRVLAKQIREKKLLKIVESKDKDVHGPRMPRTTTKVRKGLIYQPADDRELQTCEKSSVHPLVYLHVRVGRQRQILTYDMRNITETLPHEEQHRAADIWEIVHTSSSLSREVLTCGKWNITETLPHLGLVHT